MGEDGRERGREGEREIERRMEDDRKRDMLYIESDCDRGREIDRDRE